MNVSHRLIAILFLVPLLVSAEGQKGARYGGYVLAEDGASEAVAAQLNLAMMKLFAETFSDPEIHDVWLPLELRFDAGQLRKRDRSRAQKHFDEMFRRMAKGEFDEAYEQVFRAQRFARRSFPYSMDFKLFAEILYYRSRVDEGKGEMEAAKDSYCTYLYLMSNLSRSSVSVGQKLPDLKACKAGDETGELVVSAKLDGGVVFLDGTPVRSVSKNVPYAAPFLARGIHFVEVRKPGFARWGEVVEVKPGKSIKKRARLKRPRSGVNERELQPLEGIILSGSEKSDQSYVQDLLFQYSQQVGVDVFVLGKVVRRSGEKLQLDLLRYDAMGLKTVSVPFDANGFEFELVMLSALRQLDISVRSVSNTTPREDVGFLL